MNMKEIKLHAIKIQIFDLTLILLVFYKTGVLKNGLRFEMRTNTKSVSYRHRLIFLVGKGTEIQKKSKHIYR